MEEHIDVIIKQTVTEQISVDPDLKARIARFTDMVLDEAERRLRFGISKERMDIIKMVLGPATKSVGKDFTTTENAATLALEDIFTSMRRIDEVPDAAPVAALAPPVDDPDEGSHDGTIPDRQ